MIAITIASPIRESRFLKQDLFALQIFTIGGFVALLSNNGVDDDGIINVPAGKVALGVGPFYMVHVGSEDRWEIFIAGPPLLQIGGAGIILRKTRKHRAGLLLLVEEAFEGLPVNPAECSEV